MSHELSLDLLLKDAGVHRHLLEMMKNPANLEFTYSVLFKGIKLLPHQLATVQEYWAPRALPATDQNVILSYEPENSLALAVYAMLRALLEQNHEIMILGSSFRSAKKVFDKCNDLWNDSPILRDMVSFDNLRGPKRDVDRFSMKLGGSRIYAAPLGTGEKLRGMRPTILLVTELGSVCPKTLNTVLNGFGAIKKASL